MSSSLVAIFCLAFVCHVAWAKEAVEEGKRLSPLIKRTLTCVESSTNPKAACSLTVESDTKARDASCFEEVNKEDSKPRIYCKLNCKNGPVSTVVVEKQPTSVQACVKHFTYNTERRDNDWFLWRSDACLNKSVTFEVGLEDTYCE